MDTRDKAAAQKLFATPRGRMDERGWGYTLYRYRSGPADEATRRYAALAKKVAMPRLTPSTHLPLAVASVHTLPHCGACTCVCGTQAGMPLTEMSLRWARERSSVTTSLIGHTSMAQLDESLKYFQKKEPLPYELMCEIDRVHMRNRLPIFASTRVGSDWSGEGEIGEPIP